MKKYKILITGGSGFLGSHLADFISNKGHQVTIFDNIKSKYASNSQRQITGSILDEKLVNKAVRHNDYVFHFAGISNIEKSKSDPRKTITSNILGTQIILDSCRKYKIKRLIFSSSIYVYSDLGSFYRLSKQTCENLIEEYSKEFKLNYTILRFGSLYGTRANETNSITNFLSQAIQKKQIRISSDGEELREYIHVEDAVRISLEMIKEKYRNKNFIITGNQLIKINELLFMIKEIFNNKIKINYKKNKNYINNFDYHHYKISPYSYSPTKAKKITPNPSVDFGQGILEIIYEIEKNLKK